MLFETFLQRTGFPEGAMNMLDLLFASKRRTAPDWIKAYWELKFKFQPDTPLDEIPFCALDCETTGLEKTSEVISVGAVKLINRKIKVSDTLDLRFAVSKGQKQSEIHEELVQEAEINNEEQVRILLSYIGNAVIIGHHIAFDISKVSQMVSQYHKGFALKNKSTDTFNLMKRVDPMRFERNVGGLKTMKMDALCEEFNIDIENRHTAVGDAYMSAQIFVKLLRLLRKRKIETISDL